MLASLDDINTFIPNDKLRATEGNDEVARFQTDVTRTVKGLLSTVFTPAILGAWIDPDSTPEYIRGVAGRFVAAYWYASKTSESIPDWDKTYPQRIYDEAMALLNKVISGDVDLGLVDEAGAQFSNEWFRPNANSTPPKFTMDMNL